MNIDEAKQVLDGAMISDAGVYFAHGGGVDENAYFDIALSGWKHDDWLKVIADALIVLVPSIHANDITYRKATRTNGETYERCGLRSRTHPVFTSMRRKWYPEGIKLILPDLVVTPLMLSHWFTGDGDSVWNASGIPNMVEARLSVNCFTREDVDKLRKQLEGFGLTTSLEIRHETVKGAGIRLRIRNATQVNIFMDMVEPNIVPSYKYKIKRPWLKKRGPTTVNPYIYRWISGGWKRTERAILA